MIPRASERRVCRLLDVPRSSLRSAPAEKRLRHPLDAVLVERVRELIKDHPTFGYRKLWALLRYGEGLIVNLKAVYRILKAKRWFVHQRSVTPRPRVQGRRSIAPVSDSRWAIDLTHVYCGEDGWGHLAAISDCCDREIVGWEFSLRGRAREAERALEEACLHRFGTLRPERPTPVIRSDNGLIFTARRFRAACRDYRLRQEFITPYTPEQNGMIQALLPQSQGGVRLAAQLRRLRRGTGGDRQLDSLGQRASSPSGARLPEPASVQVATTTGGGLR